MGKLSEIRRTKDISLLTQEKPHETSRKHCFNYNRLDHSVCLLG
jgi:hypothetical protein